MKKTACILTACLLFAHVGVFAQPDSAKRDITVKVVDRKGKPISNIAVQASSAETGGATDREGVYLLPGLQNGDSVTLVFPRIGEVYVPVQQGVEFILLTVKSNRELEAVDTSTNRVVDLGYGGVAESRSTGVATVIDVPSLLRETGAIDLVRLLDGQVPGVQVGMDGTGTASLSLRGRGTPLFIVDGTEIFSDTSPLQTVMERYPVHQLQTITIDMVGAAYGFRGSNGVVLITTRR